MRGSIVSKHKFEIYKDVIASFWHRFKVNKMGMAGLGILFIWTMLAIFAPLMPIHNPYSFGRSSQDCWKEPSFEHLLGTDELGRDVLSRVIFGSRTTIIVGISATIIIMLLGSTVGLLSGYYGRGVDIFLMRITDVFLVIPWLPFVLVLISLLPGGSSISKTILAIGLLGWPGTSRIIRSQVLAIKEKTFIERSRAMGGGDIHIIKVHIFPNILPLVFANTALIVAISIASDAILGFVGFADPTMISLGGMLNDALQMGAIDRNAYWYVIAPGLSIITITLGFVLMNLALDELLNPRLKG